MKSEIRWIVEEVDLEILLQSAKVIERYLLHSHLRGYAQI